MIKKIMPIRIKIMSISNETGVINRDPSYFTLAETNLMVIYNPGTRLGLIEELKAMMKYLSPEETELHDLTLSTLRKLERMTDTAFAALDLEIDGL